MTVTGLWTCRLAVETTLDLRDLESACNPLFSYFLPDNVGDLFSHDHSIVGDRDLFDLLSSCSFVLLHEEIKLAAIIR